MSIDTCDTTGEEFTIPDIDLMILKPRRNDYVKYNH